MDHYPDHQATHGESEGTCPHPAGHAKHPDMAGLAEGHPAGHAKHPDMAGLAEGSCAHPAGHDKHPDMAGPLMR
jgi:hypothetical protein